MTAWETVVGLEVHVQLLTRTKMFCGCSAKYGDPPNTNVCPACLALPGALPAPNMEAIRLAVRAALALGCTVHPRSVFARKNYFYPDLPKGYQISQFDEPLATRGALDIVSPERGPITIGITRLHLEEDAGKSFHDRFPGRTAVDLNRSGVPLIEIVSEPDLRSPAEARAYLTALKHLLRWVAVSDCNMEEGSLRVDANLSLRRPGAPLGTRTEVKNMNSFSGVERALAVERERQQRVLESGGIVVQTTMTFDAIRNEVRPMRSKEESHDYRYFPEPDLPPLVLRREWLEQQRTDLPELPAAKKRRLIAEGLNEYDATVVTSTATLGAAYERIRGLDVAPKEAANWLINDVLSLTEDRESDLPVSAERIAEVVRLVQAQTISRQSGRKVLEELSKNGGRSAAQAAEQLGLIQVQDTGQIDAWVREVIAAHPAEVARLRAGEGKLIGFLTGQVMKLSRGKADAKAVGTALQAALK